MTSPHPRALDVGFAQALWDAGTSFDLIIGSSVGALNGAFLASGRTPDQLAAVWGPLRFRDLFRINWLELLARGMGARSIYRLGRRLGLRFAKLPARFADLAIPFVAVATDLATGAPVAFDRGELLPALLASAAIPGMWPPIMHGGRLLVDGSLSAHLPLEEARRRGATEIWGIRSSCTASPTTKIGPRDRRLMSRMLSTRLRGLRKAGPWRRVSSPQEACELPHVTHAWTHP